MIRIKYEKIMGDFGIFAATLCVVIAILLGLHIKVPLVYLNLLLGCGIILGILWIICLIRYLARLRLTSNKESANNRYEYNKDNGTQVGSAIGSADVINPINVATNKSDTNKSSHSYILSFLTKIKERYSE
ncbi:hypothetical protein ACFLUZ_02995 [Chloroflexota bacterium]